MSINEQLGEGGKHRKEIYEAIGEVLGIDIQKQGKLHDRLKAIVLEYVSDRQKDIVDRLLDAHNKNNVMQEQLNMLVEGTHLICKGCKQVRGKGKF